MDKIKICVNDSLESRFLIGNNIISPDFIKYPSITKPCIEDFNEINGNILYHGLASKCSFLPDILSDSFIENLDLSTTKYFLESSASPGISIHIGDNLKNSDNATCLNNAMRNIAYVKNTLMTSNMDFISLENMEKGSSLNTLDPNFISELVYKTGVYFLLDTAHATIAAHVLNMDLKEYISLLPLDKLYEIHFSGTYKIDGKVYSHIRAYDHDYEILEYALSFNVPKIITLEYGVPFKKDTKYFGDFYKALPKVSYKELNEDASNELLEMYEKTTKLIKKI